MALIGARGLNPEPISLSALTRASFGAKRLSRRASCRGERRWRPDDSPGRRARRAANAPAPHHGACQDAELGRRRGRFHHCRRRGLHRDAGLELERGEDKVLEATIDYYRQVSASAETTLNALMMRQASSNEALLISAYRASQYAWAPNLRATFDELVATGDLSLIHDAKLRDIAVAFYTGEAFEISDVEGRQSRYREAFRMTIAPETYRAITKACGDRPDAANGANISYVCKLDLPQADIDDAAEALRANKELSALLRLRIAELDNELDSFVTVKDFLESSLGDYEKSARRRSD